MKKNLRRLPKITLGAMILGITFGLTTSCKKEFQSSSNHPSPTLKSSVAPAPSEYKDIYLGSGLEYDKGARTNIAMNANSQVIEVHKNQTGTTLWYRTGYVDRGLLKWKGGAIKYDNGKDPSVAMNQHNTVVEVHKTQSPFSSKMYYHVGHFNGNSISWGGSHSYDKGSTPSVAVNRHNVVVEVHKSQSKNELWYHVGTVNPSNKTINFGGSIKYDGGAKEPTVALNNNNQVVLVNETSGGGSLYYRVGTVNTHNKTLSLGPVRWYASGSCPAVTLSDDGTVYEIHREGGDWLYSKKGKISGNTINWTSNRKFDSGIQPSVAANDTYVVQSHDATNTDGLWASVGLITDHSNWMYRNLNYIGNKRLKDIVFPGSHDAGMYGFSLGQTQYHNMYDQLKDGIRYFDLRPNTNMHVYHGPVEGPSVDEILNDVKSYMDLGSRELVILKFSHYGDGFNSSHYSTLVDKIKNKLGGYLFDKPAGKRLAEITMSEYLNDGGKVLIVCDSNYPIYSPETGIYTYRDYDSGSAHLGDFIVYDKYSNSMSYSSMSSDQLNKFSNYNGLTSNGNHVCDFFLLSWTLTPPTAVALFAPAANRHLPEAMYSLNPNQHGYIPNILYVDFVEHSHATDMAIIANKRY